MRAWGLPAHFHCGALFRQKSQYNVDQRTCKQLHRHRRTSTDFDPSFSAVLRHRSAIPLHVWNDTNINPAIGSNTLDIRWPTRRLLPANGHIWCKYLDINYWKGKVPGATSVWDCGAYASGIVWNLKGSKSTLNHSRWSRVHDSVWRSSTEMRNNTWNLRCWGFGVGGVGWLMFWLTFWLCFRFDKANLEGEPILDLREMPIILKKRRDWRGDRLVFECWYR
jgi:hypothetical protein